MVKPLTKKDGRKPEYVEKTPDDELRECSHKCGCRTPRTDTDKGRTVISVLCCRQCAAVSLGGRQPGPVGRDRHRGRRHRRIKPGHTDRRHHG